MTIPGLKHVDIIGKHTFYKSVYTVNSNVFIRCCN